MAYDSASGRIKHYRVDKMKNITITDLPRDGAETMEHLDLTIYTRRLFGMFGGEPIRVTLEGDGDMINVLIDRFGDPPPSVYTLVQVALLRSDAGKVGVTDISQKNGCLKFLLAQFDMQKVSLLYARPEFKGRLKVDAGAKPGVILRLKSRDHVIEQARAFVSAWADAREERA